MTMPAMAPPDRPELEDEGGDAAPVLLEELVTSTTGLPELLLEELLLMALLSDGAVGPAVDGATVRLDEDRTAVPPLTLLAGDAVDAFTPKPANGV
jgi:hypothetical protein